MTPGDACVMLDIGGLPVVHVLSAAMMSLHKEQMCGVPEVPK